MELVIVAAVAFASAVLSAVAGLGGGLVLLAVVAQFHPPAVAIPIQGSAYLVATSTRSLLLRRDIDWGVVWRTGILQLPASVVGVAIATAAPDDLMRIAMAIFIVVVTWRPRLLGGSRTVPRNAMIGVGVVAGIINAAIGSSGPFTAPFYRAILATHRAFVATAAATSVIGHTAKLIAYAANGFHFGDHLATIVLSMAGVLAGTLLGARVLRQLPEERLAQLVRVVLTVLAIRLAGQALL